MIIGKTAYAASPSHEDNRVFDTTAALNAYLASANAKAGQGVKLLDTTSNKYKSYIIQGTPGNFTYTPMGAGDYVANELPNVSAGDMDLNYYIYDSAAGIYKHYRFNGTNFVLIGGDSYSKSQTYNKTQADSTFMKLADDSIDNIRVPASNSAPDTSSAAYGALNVGQVFVCVIDDEQTYWIKQSASSCKNISKSGKDFDCGRVDDDGLLHLTLNGTDIDGFEPFYVGTGSGGGGAGVNLSDVVKPTSVRNGANAIFSFVATETSDEDITVKWYVDNVLIETQPNRASGSTFSFNAKDYLKASDTSTVKAAITSVGGAKLNRQWDVTSTAFSLAWGDGISPIMLQSTSENVYFVIKVSAQANSENVVTLSIGNYTATKDVIGSRNITFELTPERFAAGANTITAVMATKEDENDTCDPITCKVIWSTGVNAPVVAFATSSMSVTQYDEAVINYFVYNPLEEVTDCTMQFGSATPRTLQPNRTMQTIRYSPQSYGSETVTLTCGASSTTMTLTIAQSDYNIGMITGDNLRYNVDPTGHSNTDSDKTSFGNMTFSSNFDWVNGGFHTDADGAAFVVKKGHRATLPRQIFGDADGNGKTIDLSFKVKNSDLYDAVAMQEVNNGDTPTKGLILRANEGELRLNNTTGQLFRYCEDSRIDLSINVESIVPQRVMTVWLDGIPALVNQYSVGTLVQDENALVIGSDHCDVWVYAIRVYNTDLSFKDMIQNYISLAPTTSAKVQRCKDNDIYSGNLVSKALLHTAHPDLTLVTIAANRIPGGKGKSDYVDALVTIQDGGDTLSLGEGTRYRLQGTSSLSKIRSAGNLDIDFSKTDETYKISENSIPVSYINIKVNVASSENANNICAADEYNTHQPYLVPARATEGVRDTVEGKPCAVFFTNTSSNTVWAGSQEVPAGQTILYAMGDICNSKKNLEVFGQDGTGEHYAKGCIEVSGNDTMAQQFRATSTFNPSADDGKGAWETTVIEDGQTKVMTDYEWRAEPKEEDYTEVVTAWNDAVAWVVSTNMAAATDENLSEPVEYNGVTYTTDSAAYRLAKFNAEVSNYFALKSLLYHFLYLEYFAALDNVSKNTFYSYEYDATANKYLWNICKNYDDDTILGCDNDGKPLVDYGVDYGEVISGSRSPFNAVGNTIWVNIQQGRSQDLADLYVTLRGKGAFNATSIINKWDNYQAKRPHAAMAEDAYNKYILPYKTTGVIVGNDSEPKSYDATYLDCLQGSKTYPRKQFITYQSKYMDGKYGYYVPGSAITFRCNAASGTTKNLTVKAYAKTYVTLVVDNGTSVSHKIAKGGTAVFSNTAIHDNATIYLTPESLIEYVTPLAGTEATLFTATGANKLSDVSLGDGESTNTSWSANTSLTIPSEVLKTLSIRNLTNFGQDLTLTANAELESIDTRGTNTGIITFPAYAPLETINLNACTGIKAKNLNNVETFTMASGSNLISVIAENCNETMNNALVTYLTNAVNAGGTTTRRIRMTGINWTVSNAQLLMALADNWKGYNALWAEINTPVLTGTVTVQSIKQRELDYLESVFGEELTIVPRRIVTEYTITYKNYDNTLLGTDYVQEGYTINDPIESGLFSTPTKSSDLTSDYTFDGWDNSIAGAVWENKTFTATFASSAREYTVQFVVIDANDEETVNYSTTGSYGGTVQWAGTVTPTTAPISAAAFPVFQDWHYGSYTYDLRESIEITEGLATPFVSTGIIKLPARFAQCSLPPAVDKTQYDYLWTNDTENFTSAYTLEGLYAICMSEQYKDYLSLGDKIRISLKDTGTITDKAIIYSVQGFNHYEKSNSPIAATRDISDPKRAWAKQATGDPLENGAENIGGTTYTNDTEEYRVAKFRQQYMAHVVFGCVDVYNAGHAIHSGNTNVGGYALSQLPAYIENSIVPTMPDMLRSMITPVKICSNGGQNAPTTITTLVCNLFPFNYTEVGFGATSPFVDEISDYAETNALPVYSSQSARIKKQFNLTGTGSAVSWWLRSPNTGNTNYYYNVYTNGNSFNNAANYGNSLALGFCMG